MSLRARLLVGVLALTAVAMVVVGVVVWRVLDHYLIQQVDRDLQRSSGPIVSFVRRGVLPPDRPDERGFTQNRYYVEVRDATGVRQERFVQQGSEQLAAPKLLAATTVPEGEVKYVTTSSVGGSPTYRAQVTNLGGGVSVVVATPINDVEDTLSHLVTVEVIATGLVLLALTGLVIWVVRRGLRPLGDVVTAADGVAGGDLSHRVPVTNPNTEVGHLGVAFNTMVDRIEESFAERDESEDR
ncbi:MAG TPA: HAMP domain-containing protein, partial [Acidimicrobiales bacterium]|nr:HAMP domain-containing protein [Acidimicrobiales bacterium]